MSKIKLYPLFDTLEHLNDEQPTNLANHQYNDYKHANNFLYSYRGSEATFNSYRRELERLLQWCWFIVNKTLPQLKRTDIEQFIEFCQNPPKDWIGLKNVPRFIISDGARKANPEWRPFVVTINKESLNNDKHQAIKHYSLSQKALQAIFAVISSFYNYLIQEEYVDFNPVAQIRQKSKFIRKQQSAPIIRRLSELQWSYVIETAELLANQNSEEHERTLFIMEALYGMYLRISELVASARWQPKMSDFFRDMDGNWWFRTVGKGNKERIITVSDAMLSALKRYRSKLGLPPLPTTGDSMPLIFKQRGKGPITSTRHIRSIVQFCFDSATNRLQQDGFHEEAQQLQAATVHWLRHTGISDDVKHRPREHVRDDAGHGSSAITDRYIDVELRARHASGKSKKLKPEE